MNILPANELKKYGIMAIQKKLKNGPVHVLKHNSPVFVALTEKDYQILSSKKLTKSSGLFSLLSKPATGKHSKKEIDQQLKQARKNWDQ